MIEKPEYIVFDLGGTIFGNMTDDIEAGLKFLEELSSEKKSIDKMKIFQDIFGKYILSQENNLEYSFRSFFALFSDIGQMKFDKEIEEIEREFFMIAYKYEGLQPGIKEILRYLKNSGIKTAIFSNSSFSAKTLIYKLKNEGINTDDFEFILSSADYGIAKPDSLVFEAIISKCRVKREKIWYIGDSFCNDVEGAANAGIVPVWYNCETKPDRHSDIVEIGEWRELINILEEIK